MKIINITNDSIKLGQAMKLTNLVEKGADAKFLLQKNLVKVNGEIEVRRGSKLYVGDVFSFYGKNVKIVQ